MSLDRGMDKEDVVHIHSGIPLALRRKETINKIKRQRLEWEKTIATDKGLISKIYKQLI